MLWPIILPLQVTLLLLSAAVAIATLLAPVVKWKRFKVFVNAVVLAGVAFIPALVAIRAIIDPYRFGVFQYDAFADVHDFRVERYLPTKAREITVQKGAGGHRAKYAISEADLMEYLDGLWNKYGALSAITREQLHSTSYVAMDQHTAFGDLGWPVLENAIVLHSPVQSNGAGATYYFDPKTSTAYHSAGYW